MSPKIPSEQVFLDFLKFRQSWCRLCLQFRLNLFLILYTLYTNTIADTNNGNISENLIEISTDSIMSVALNGNDILEGFKYLIAAKSLWTLKEVLAVIGFLYDLDESDSANGIDLIHLDSDYNMKETKLSPALLIKTE